ncbi:conserved hypothetical protein [Nitrosococcus halophilus Nc 4]|uniref:DUF4340 domain-containing protein n=1 Tax=Nitrosococcus halophilus (strain Nc4) TaxID=472759 RepID=D5BZM7_NITHN|nr:DUF4340 domain-containing protein [Nitrosococcus halophilus]ADE14322.1 conserved hypothetical protein [Nitrosococcus halophilus Nc 4]
MKMKKWISILGGLLLVQLVLAIAVNLMGEDYGAFEPQEKLLAFDEKGVDGLRIEDGENSLVLKKRDGKWLLPDSGDFPADQEAVERLLDKLATLEKGWPVATTAGAAKRFKVDDEAFERRLALLIKEETQAVLYVGTSPGFRKVHVRPEGEDAVYAVAFNTWEANAKADDWIDKDILRLEGDQVTRVEMPEFTLQRNDEQWQLVSLKAQEETNGEEARALVDKLTGLPIESLLGTEAKPSFRQEAPEFEVKLARKGGDLLSYRFSKPEDEDYYVLKRSDLDHYFKVAPFAVEPIQTTGREKLVQTKTEEAPSETSGGDISAEAEVEAAEVQE